MAVVIDASAAMQIATGSDEGLAMGSLIMESEEVFAPDLLQLECASGFWKYVHAGMLSTTEARAYYEDSVRLVTRFVRESSLLPEVFAEAARLDHPVYDVVYLVLARRLAATLMSFDGKLVELCEREGVECVMPVTV